MNEALEHAWLIINLLKHQILVAEKIPQKDRENSRKGRDNIHENVLGRNNASAECPDRRGNSDVQEPSEDRHGVKFRHLARMGFRARLERPILVPKKTVRSGGEKRDALEHRKDSRPGQNTPQERFEIQRSEIDHTVQRPDRSEFGELVDDPDRTPYICRNKKRRWRTQKKEEERGDAYFGKRSAGRIHDPPREIGNHGLDQKPHRDPYDDRQNKILFSHPFENFVRLPKLVHNRNLDFHFLSSRLNRWS